MNGRITWTIVQQNISDHFHQKQNWCTKFLFIKYYMFFSKKKKNGPTYYNIYHSFLNDLIWQIIICITLSNGTERGGPQNEDPLLCTLTQQQKRQERSFEQGVKRFSCLIQPPRKLSKTKDPSRDYCTHVLSMLWELKMKPFLKFYSSFALFAPTKMVAAMLLQPLRWPHSAGFRI